MQDSDCDSNPTTSDGIAVLLLEHIDIVNVADIIEGSGILGENFDLTEISAAPSNVNLLSTDNPLPANQ